MLHMDQRVLPLATWWDLTAGNVAGWWCPPADREEIILSVSVSPISRKTFTIIRAIPVSLKLCSLEDLQVINNTLGIGSK